MTTLRTDDGREILVSWTPLTLVEAKSLIQFYRVIFDPVSRKRQSGATCSQSPCDVPGTEISVMITGLDPSTSYVVQVSVVNGGGQRGPSAVVIAEGEPAMMQNCSKANLALLITMCYWLWCILHVKPNRKVVVPMVLELPCLLFFYL